MNAQIKVPFCKPDIRTSDKTSVLKALDSQWLTGGQRTVEFEKRFAEYIGVKHAVAVNSCTAALHLAMRALSIGEGDEVIVPTLTFAATANAPIFCGAKPVFADIDEDTLNISPEDIEGKITDKTRAIIPVHIGGQPAEMRDILRIALEHHIHIVEDCAHSLGATYNGLQTGGMSSCSCFSFYPTKPATTGEGGMLATNSDEIAKYVKLVRSHGMTKEAWVRASTATWEYDIADLGYNYRLDELSSALGLSQLARIDRMNAQRAKVAEFYAERLKNINGIVTPKLADNRTSSWHLYIVRIKEKEFGMSRDQLFVELAKKGVECSVHYKPLHLMSFYQKQYGYKMGDFPVAEKVYGEILSLPIFSSMLPYQMEYVAKSIEELAKCG